MQGGVNHSGVARNHGLKWWVKESSTFGFPPSVHGAVGALADVAVFHREVNGGGAFGHGGGATSEAKRQ